MSAEYKLHFVDAQAFEQNSQADPKDSDAVAHQEKLQGSFESELELVHLHKMLAKSSPIEQQELDKKLQGLKKRLKNTHALIPFKLGELGNFEANEADETSDTHYTLCFKLISPKITDLNKILGYTKTDAFLKKLHELLTSKLSNPEKGASSGIKLATTHFKSGEALITVPKSTIHESLGTLKKTLKSIEQDLYAYLGLQRTVLTKETTIVVGLSPVQNTEGQAPTEASLEQSFLEAALLANLAQYRKNGSGGGSIQLGTLPADQKKSPQENPHNESEATEADLNYRVLVYERTTLLHHDTKELDKFLSYEIKGDGQTRPGIGRIWAYFEENHPSLMEIVSRDGKDYRIPKRDVLSALRKGLPQAELKKLTQPEKLALQKLGDVCNVLDLIKDYTLRSKNSFEDYLNRIVAALQLSEETSEEKITKFKSLYALAKESPKNKDPENVISRTRLALAEALYDHTFKASEATTSEAAEATSEKSPSREAQFIFGDYIGFGSKNWQDLAILAKQLYLEDNSFTPEKRIGKLTQEAGDPGNEGLRDGDQIMDQNLSTETSRPTLDASGGDEVRALTHSTHDKITACLGALAEQGLPMRAAVFTVPSFKTTENPERNTTEATSDSPTQHPVLKQLAAWWARASLYGEKVLHTLS